jgi:putative transcriptional regulator
VVASRRVRILRALAFVPSGMAVLVLHPWLLPVSAGGCASAVRSPATCMLQSTSCIAADAQAHLPAPLRRGAVKELAAGKLLVAARSLADPNFAETIILLTEFSDKGGMGIILNRRTDVTLTSIAPGVDVPGGDPVLVFFGGPVAVPGVIALKRAASPPAGTRHVVADIHLVNTREVLEHTIRAGADSGRLRVYVGYAGWAADQLNAETAAGSWHVVEADGEIVFDPEPDSAWERQIRRTEALQAQGGLADPPRLVRD